MHQPRSLALCCKTLSSYVCGAAWVRDARSRCIRCYRARSCQARSRQGQQQFNNLNKLPGLGSVAPVEVGPGPMPECKISFVPAVVGARDVFRIEIFLDGRFPSECENVGLHIHRVSHGIKRLPVSALFLTGNKVIGRSPCCPLIPYAEPCRFRGDDVSGTHFVAREGGQLWPL